MPTIIEAITELKNWAWEGAAYPLEDLARKIKTIEQVVPTKNIVSIPIKFVFASITIPVESVCDSIPIESISVESIESVKSSFSFNMISDSAYLLALNVFNFEIGKETLNNKELKQRHLEPIKEETQPIN